MNWTQLLEKKVETAYSTTSKLLEKVDPESLDWKPASGRNWMTVGQLLRHISEACGTGCRGFVTEDSGLPAGVTWETIAPEQMFPPAEKLPSIESVGEAKCLLAKDRTLALQTIEMAGEDKLEAEVDAPWAPGKPLPLGQHLLQMIQHLERHETQLFYYLKLQGKSVNTLDLWGE
ncbi:MAG: DinB family protein [Terracidiphilus sp.]